MVVHSTLFTIHGKVMGKNDLNSQETYICYYQGLNLNWFSDVDIVQWSQEYHNNSVLTYLSQDHEELEALCLIIFWSEGISTMIVWWMTFVTRFYATEKCGAKFTDHFWKCWLHEYLPSWSKWTVQKEKINMNDLVLIKEDHTKCGLWSLGRVVEVHSEEDGVAWVVTVQTSKSTYKHPALKISQ